MKLKNLYICMLSIFAIFLFWSDNALAAASAGAQADLIQKRYEQTNSFEATFEQTLSHKESGSIEKRKGRLLFQKPLLIRWQTDKPHEETLVVTGKEIWDYIPEEELAYRYPPSLVQDSRSIIQVLTGQAKLTRDFEVKNAGNENGLAKLQLYPNEPTTQMVEAMIWLQPDTGYIRRAQITDFYGNTNEINFTDFKPNIAVNSANFNFIPPKGTEIEDRMDREIQERELFH